MKQIWKDWKWLPMVLVGCLIVAVGFDMFLLPNGINGGGLSGLAMVLVEWTGGYSLHHDECPSVYSGRQEDW